LQLFAIVIFFFEMSFFQTENVLQLTTNESLVGCEISDGRTVFSIIEYITKRYKKKDSTYAYQTVSRLKNSTKYKELEEYVVNGPLGGSKKSMTPCTCVTGLQVLLSILDDEVGAEYRKLARTTVTRVGAGDPTLKDVIDANAASSAPNAELLREALAHERASGGASIAESPMQVLDMCGYDVL